MRPENEQQTNIHDKRRENTLNGLKWLLERGAEGRTTRRFRNYPSNDLQLLSHMSTALLASMQLGHSKRSMEALFNMLKMLSSHGYPNPTRSDTFDPAWLFPNNYEWRCVRLSFYSKVSPMCITLKSHVVPSVLELMLSEHADRGNKLRDRDLHEEGTGWEEAYFGEVADIFQAKLKLMVKYEMIDASEEALLKSIGSALYSIAADGMQAGGYDQEHIKRSWEKLCDAVKPFATDRNLVVVNPDGAQHRIHRFVIDPEWNPWESWFWRQDEIRWMREGASSIYASRGTLSVPYERASSLGVPEWHTVSIDAWYASFPRSG
ncbi:hypothetical protein FCULG_00004351 [Fusarium culmorum]|uniref:Uncharacterized protein n=1 Tax=Fusarium culmorum TaxID=5516 RepID=A0A2T4H9D6_FUSCU|nr:hypothetical protein FCULG_00004351 [Fusarium culmorum]